MAETPWEIVVGGWALAAPYVLETVLLRPPHEELRPGVSSIGVPEIVSTTSAQDGIMAISASGEEPIFRLIGFSSHVSTP